MSDPSLLAAGIWLAIAAIIAVVLFITSYFVKPSAKRSKLLRGLTIFDCFVYNVLCTESRGGKICDLRFLFVIGNTLT